MKQILVACMLCVLFASSALSELTQEDLDKIRLLVNEEVSKSVAASEARLKAEIAASEARMKQYVDLKIENVETQIKAVETRILSVEKQILSVEKQILSVEKQVTHSTNLTYGLIALIVAAVGIPQIIMVWRSRSDRSLERRIEELSEDIETLKKQRIVTP